MLTLALLACSSPTTAPLPPGDPARPDVILVSIDTLRADHLGAWGYERATSPRLDALAASGTRFASAWAPSPWTLPSHATILSGALPLRHGAIESDRAVADGVPWLPEAFRAAGYGTIGVVSTWFLSDRYGFSRGFDAWTDFDRTEKNNLKDSPRADDVLAEALARAAASPPGQPQLVFLHLYDAHYPYDPPAPFDERFDRAPQAGDLKYRKYEWYLDHPVSAEQMAHQTAQYDEEIARVDDRLGAFLDAWKAGGREAIVMIVSDHGEELGERGSWGHGHTLWPEQLHVPWIVAGPGIVAQSVEARVGLEDVAPTVAGLAGVPFPATDGLDRSAALRGDPVISGASGRFAETSRFDTLRFRWHEPPYDLQADLRSGALQLCDLRADPTCDQDVSVDHFEEVVAIEKGMYAWLGAPFEAVQSGELTSPGVFVVYGQRAPGRLAVHDRVRFGLFPPDAPFAFGNGTGVDGGPWQVLGGALPDEVDPIRYDGAALRTGAVPLDDDEKAALEALGYVQ